MSVIRPSKNLRWNEKKSCPVTSMEHACLASHRWTNFADPIPECSMKSTVLLIKGFPAACRYHEVYRSKTQGKGREEEPSITYLLRRGFSLWKWGRWWARQPPRATPRWSRTSSRPCRSIFLKVKNIQTPVPPVPFKETKHQVAARWRKFHETDQSVGSNRDVRNSSNSQ